MFLRVDIDFPYPKQSQNYLNLLLGLKFRNYLEQSKMLCRLLNKYNATAIWFPTILVAPDSELLKLLDEGGHEIGCQIIWSENEVKKLEALLGRKIRFYVIHGTSTLINKILWRRLYPPSIKSKEIIRFGGDIDFDKLCYWHSPSEILKMFKKLNSKTVVVTHPTYINRRSFLSKKGPTFKALSLLLKEGIKFESV